MLNYQLEDLITGDKLVRYHLLGGGVLALSHTGSRGAALRLRSVTGAGE